MELLVIRRRDISGSRFVDLLLLYCLVVGGGSADGCSSTIFDFSAVGIDEIGDDITICTSLWMTLLGV